MTKKIAFITRRAPHGQANAREGLDAILATAAFCDDIGVFFIADGIYQLINDQQPDACLQRNISPTFGMLELYDIAPIYSCESSLSERGISSSQLSLTTTTLSASQLTQQLTHYDHIIHF